MTMMMDNHGTTDAERQINCHVPPGIHAGDVKERRENK